MDTTRIALAITLVGTSFFCSAARAQDAGAVARKHAWIAPLAVAPAIGPHVVVIQVAAPLKGPAPAPAPAPAAAPSRAVLRRVRLGVVYTHSAPTSAFTEVRVPELRAQETRSEIESTHGVHATVEVPLAPAIALGARVGLRSWSIGGERDLGFSAHTTFDIGGLVVARIPYLWSSSLEVGGVRVLGVGGISVDTVGWDNRNITTELEARFGWHAGGGLGFEWLIAGRVSLTCDFMYVQRQTRIHFDVPGGAAGTIAHRTHELSLALGVNVIL